MPPVIVMGLQQKIIGNKEDKKMKSRIRELKNFGFVVIAVLAAVLSSCSSDDSIIEELQQPAEAQTYTMTVQAHYNGQYTGHQYWFL